MTFVIVSQEELQEVINNLCEAQIADALIQLEDIQTKSPLIVGISDIIKPDKFVTGD